MAKLIFIVSVIFIYLSPLKAQREQIIFEIWDNVSLADWVRCMYQDSRGFIWIGTVDEVRRFDGYNFIRYESQPGDTNSISGNYITCIAEDHENYLWFGTRSTGLNKYNPFTDKFTRYKHDQQNPLSISSNQIKAILEDRDLNLWIACDNALNKLDRRTNKFFKYKHDSRGTINSISEFGKGKLWIATSAGLFLFDLNQKRFFSFGEYFKQDGIFKDQNITFCYPEDSGVFWIGADGLYRFDKNLQEISHYPINTPNSHPLNSNTIQAICDAGSYLWLGTVDGLYQFYKKGKNYIRHESDQNNYLSLFGNNIKAILKDRGGCYWFGCSIKGINKKNSIRENVKFYLPNPFESASIEDRITSLFLTKSGRIWIGTDVHGFLSFDKKMGKFRNFKHNPGNLNSLSSNYVTDVIEDRNSFVWIATGEGLNRFDPSGENFSHYKNDPKNENSISHSHVLSIAESESGSIFVGTLDGFNEFNPVSEKFTRYKTNPNDPFSISHNIIQAIIEDSERQIWIGTRGGGLNRFDPFTKKFTCYTNNPTDSTSISSNIVIGIYEYPYKNRPTLWIGTLGGGLCRFDKETEQFATYSKKDGLAGNRVQKIIADTNGNLWMATIETITMFNPQENTFKNFELSAEMPVNPHSCVIDQDGEIFFGGFRGMVRFFPDSMKNNPYMPQVVLTKFRVNNKPAELDTVITEKKLITLSYKENIISFEFAALDFNRPEMNQYAYKMNGVDKDWILTDATRRYAAYTNLNHGEYIFHVKASNNDGVWNEEGTSIKIIITPPWWQTTWAYFTYVILILILLYFLRQYDLKRQQLKHELALEHEHAEKLQEIDRMKSRFFANISHEFRTPLTLILGPVEQMLSGNFKTNLKEQYQMIHRNGRRLLRLINQLLDLSRLESGGVTLQVKKENIVELVRQYAQSFESLARQKKIKFNFRTEKDNIPVFVDRDKLEKILNNLLSNAFKFTDNGGVVEVEVGTGSDAEIHYPLSPFSKEERSASPLSRPFWPPNRGDGGGCFNISISDTGIGIPEDRVDRIFDRFYQVDGSKKREYEGSGIGLALTKELVELHHGNIYVESTPGKGTTFTVILPIGKEHIKAEEIIEKEETGKRRTETEKHSPPVPDTILEKSVIPERSPFSALPSPLLLIVEDNADMRAYIRHDFAAGYQIIEASDGVAGHKAAIQHIPDLIISDVMMPLMDGIELCNRLKTDQRTSHIPVILLTARAESEDKIEGLETGADDYVVKPFEIKELKVRVHNLIEQRHRLRNYYSSDTSFLPNGFTQTSADEKFIKRTTKFILTHISDRNFNLELLADELCMSRMTLHRKILGLFGQSPGHFVRTIRLKRAAELLKNKTINISEIANEVGFENPTNFSKKFRRQFGISPSHYSKQLH